MLDEKELIKLAKTGDVHAFEDLIKQHQSIVYNLAYKMFGNPEDASDIAQEALIKVFKSISSFKEESKFSTWIYKITYNVCIDELRRRKKVDVSSIDETFEDGTDSKITLVDKSPTPEQALENKEKAELIYKAIDSLSADHKAAIILRDVNGMSYDEIAEIQNCTLGTIKSRISRARQQVKEIISEYLEQNSLNKRHNNIDRR